MCRICGRFVKCIFDTMPSRTYSVPSRRWDWQHHQWWDIDDDRAFSTIRRAPITISARPITIRPATSLSPISTLTSRFGGLQLSSQTCLSAKSISPLSAVQTRSFSATALLGGPRDTFKPSRKVQKRRHGYLSRLRTKSGQAILKRRTLKRRKYLSW